MYPGITSRIMKQAGETGHAGVVEAGGYDESPFEIFRYCSQAIRINKIKHDVHSILNDIFCDGSQASRTYVA